MDNVTRMSMSLQDPDSVGKVRKIFAFLAAFRDSATDYTKLRLASLDVVNFDNWLC